MQPFIGPVGTIPYYRLNRHGRRSEIAEARRAPFTDHKLKVSYQLSVEFERRRKNRLLKRQKIEARQAARSLKK